MASTKTIISRLLMLVYLAAVCFICFASSSSIPRMSPTILGIPSDKVAHFLMFLPFPLLSYLSFDHPVKKPWKSILFVSGFFIIGCIIAGATEVIQYYLPTRAMDLADFHADAYALLASSIFVLVIDLVKKSK